MISPSASYSVLGLQKYTKISNMVTLHLCFQIKSAMSANAGIGYLPSGIRPKTKLETYCVITSDGAAETYGISTDGKLYVGSLGASTGYKEINVSYLV